MALHSPTPFLAFSPLELDVPSYSGVGISKEADFAGCWDGRQNGAQLGIESFLHFVEITLEVGVYALMTATWCSDVQA